MSFSLSIFLFSVACLNTAAAQCCEIDVTSFTQTVTYFFAGADTTFDYSITIQNTSPSSAIPDGSPADKNFNIEIGFDAFDRRSVATETITTAGVNPATDASSTVMPPGVDELSVNPSGSVTITGTSHLTLLASDCSTANYVCVHITPGTGYNDTFDWNNWRCESITKSCEVDIGITSFTPGPPTMAYGVTETQTIDFTITNAGTTAGEDIAAVSGGNKNYQIVWQLASADLAVTPGSEVGSSIPITFTSSLQQAMTHGESLVLSGSVSYALPTDNTCSTVSHVCAVLSVGTGASFQEPNPDSADNVLCQALTSPSCTPVITNLDAEVSLPENATDVANLFNVTSNGPVTYSIQSETPTVPGLAIDAKTGVLNLTGATFDFENTKTYTIVVEASGAGPSTSDTGTLTLTITDVNEAPVISLSTDTVTIPEDFTGNLTGYTLSKSDVDVSDGQGITYSIQSYPSGPSASGPFTIDSSTGVITVGTTPPLDFEQSPQAWKIEIIGVDTDAPGPPQLTSTTTLTVSITDVHDEPPTCTGLNSTVDVYENVTESLVIATVDCTGFNGTSSSIEIKMGVSPMTNKFFRSENKISYIANPGFDNELTPTYRISIFVRDGSKRMTVGYVIVNILDVIELPFFNNLPSTVEFPENFEKGMEVFYIEYTQNANDPVVNLTMVDAFPYSGLDKFKLYEPSGLVYTRYMPDLNYEVDEWYHLTFQLCAVRGCVRENLTVNIEDENEYPVCNPDNFTIVVSESTRKNTNVGLQLASGIGKKYVQDVDEGSTHGYSIVTSEFSEYISMRGDNVQLKKGFDFDQHNPPHKFTVTVAASDKSPNADQKSLKCHHTLTVYTENSNDRAPDFLSMVYTFDIPEDTPAGTVISVITVTDMDLGDFGVTDISVDPADTTAIKYFVMGPITRNGFEYTAELQVAGALDAEAHTNVIFNLIASDSVKSHDKTQSVVVRIQNVNDIRPVFSPTFYNFEVSSEAYLGKLIPYGVTQAVSATDGDIIYRDINYFLVHIISEFALDPISASLTATSPPYPDYHRYVLYMVAKDNDHEPKTSLVARARVDTYNNDDVLTNWTVNCAFSTFSTETARATFLAKVATVCTPCVPRIHEIYQSGTQTKILLYFLTDSTTDAVGNIGITKTYIPASTIMSRYTTDQVRTPTGAVSSNAALSNCPVTSITYFVTPGFNWILDTIDGNLFLGFLMSVIWTIIMTSAICLARYLFRDRGEPIRRADTPSKAKREKKVTPEQVDVEPQKEIVQEGDFNVMDFRYAGRAHVVTAIDSKVSGTL